MNETFPYRARAMFAFEEIDGVDVCFFGMHVQEYGSDSPGPNTRRYVEYIFILIYDLLKWRIDPKLSRSFTYQLLMFEYLQGLHRLFGLCSLFQTASLPYFCLPRDSVGIFGLHEEVGLYIGPHLGMSAFRRGRLHFPLSSARSKDP